MKVTKVCDMCGSQFTGKSFKVYDENHNLQRGLISCGCHMDIPDHCCPECNWEAPIFEGKHYQVNDKNYPVISNDRKYYNGHFDTHDWDETHYCPICEQEFTFTVQGV